MHKMKSTVQALSKQGPSAYSSQLNRSLKRSNGEQSSHILRSKSKSYNGVQYYITTAS